MSVTATSALGKSANLTLDGLGAMKWSNKNALWSITARNIGGNPVTATVSGKEGTESITTTIK